MSITHSSDDVVRAFQKEVAAKDHPEFAAGGYAQDDGTVEFYQRVVAVLPEGGSGSRSRRWAGREI